MFTLQSLLRQSCIELLLMQSHHILLLCIKRLKRRQKSPTDLLLKKNQFQLLVLVRKAVYSLMNKIRRSKSQCEEVTERKWILQKQICAFIFGPALLYKNSLNVHTVKSVLKCDGEKANAELDGFFTKHNQLVCLSALQNDLTFPSAVSFAKNKKGSTMQELLLS